MKIPRWLKILTLISGTIVLLIVTAVLGLAWYVKNQMLDSGGKLLPEQAAYDVRHYDLSFDIHPETQSLSGVAGITIETTARIDEFVVHLDNRLEVQTVSLEDRPLDFQHHKRADSCPARRTLESRGTPGRSHRVWRQSQGRTKTSLDRRFHLGRDTLWRTLDRRHQSRRWWGQLVALQGPSFRRTR